MHCGGWGPTSRSPANQATRTEVAPLGDGTSLAAPAAHARSIVEDEFVSRRLLTRAVEPFAEVDIAADGLEAVEAFSAARQAGQPYDLIFLDFMMPRLNGQDALRQIRRLERAAGLKLGKGAKIVIATALSDARTVMNAFREEANAFMAKPIKQDEVRRVLGELGLVARLAPTG